MKSRKPSKGFGELLWQKNTSSKESLSYCKRGDLFFNLGMYRKAVTSYDKALEIKPDLYEAWHYRGSALDDLGRLEKAIASYDEASKLNLFGSAARNKEILLRELNTLRT
jgi:tetratricopeptide (TPR) repeat protein